MVTFEANSAPVLTEEQMRELEAAEKMPVVYDEDSPKLSEKMIDAFREERRKKPYRGELLTLHVSTSALETAKTFGSDYMTILENLLDDAIAKRAAV